MRKRRLFGESCVVLDPHSEVLFTVDKVSWTQLPYNEVYLNGKDLKELKDTGKVDREFRMQVLRATTKGGLFEYYICMLKRHVNPENDIRIVLPKSLGNKTSAKVSLCNTDCVIFIFNVP